MPDQQPDDARSRWGSERTTFQRVYDVLVGTREYVAADTFARRADCSETGARSALEQLVELGIAERQPGRPRTYRRNDAYFEWKRIEELAREHTAPELRESIDDLLAEDEELQRQYGVPEPDAVTIDPDPDHDRIHETWDDLTRWRSVRRDVRLLQRALQRVERSRSDDVVSA